MQLTAGNPLLQENLAWRLNKTRRQNFSLRSGPAGKHDDVENVYMAFYVFYVCSGKRETLSLCRTAHKACFTCVLIAYN